MFTSIINPLDLFREIITNVKVLGTLAASVRGGWGDAQQV